MNAIIKTQANVWPRPVISDRIAASKYACADFGETTPAEIHRRVVPALLVNDPRADELASLWIDAMDAFEMVPGGRILATAGVARNTTMLNCFVNGSVDDSLRGIIREANGNIADTMQAGGGMGTDLDPIRPKGAHVVGTNSSASGALSYLEVFEATGRTVESAGARRGAQMSTMSIWHPDVIDFIEAKSKPGYLTGVNMSVKITEGFMRAKAEGALWDLRFPKPPHDLSKLLDQYDIDGITWYVYHRLPAIDLWNQIMKATYDRAEPGVIFIDRVNQMNNLAYCETIISSNPCGEQMLPAHGACCLGHIVLSNLVRDPFSPTATFNFARLRILVNYMTRLLDNVLSLSRYPLQEQQAEALTKRRIGIGRTGLASALMMLGLRYGSPEALTVVEQIACTMRDAAYAASIDLAQERGAFPLFDAEQYLSRPFIQALPDHIRASIAAHGIRNSHILTDAPTGTGSLYVGACTSGIEPEFALVYDRDIKQADGSIHTETLTSPTFQFYCQVNGLDQNNQSVIDTLPTYMVDTSTLTVEDHVLIQATLQKFVDASISKTVNIPEDMPFNDFSMVYDRAHELGCKGITTYRPNSVTGSVLRSKLVRTAPVAVQPSPTPATMTTKRPYRLSGETLAVPGVNSKFFLTINFIREAQGERAFEVFINTKTTVNRALLNSLTLSVSRHLRDNSDPSELLDDMLEQTGTDTIWFGADEYGKSRCLTSDSELIAYVIKEEIARRTGAMDTSAVAVQAGPVPASTDHHDHTAGQCPKCGERALVKQSGCETCTNCGHSKCG